MRIYGVCVVVALSFQLTVSLRSLHLLSVLPYPTDTTPQPSYTEGPALFLASQLAVDAINNQTDLLSDYKLELIRSNGGCNLSHHVEEVLFRKVLYTERNVQAVVGPGCSHSTLTLGNLTARPSVNLLSVSLAGTRGLSNRTRFTNTFSSLDSSTEYVQTISKIIETQGWKAVTVVHDLSRPFFQSLTTQLIELNASTTDFTLNFVGLRPGLDLASTPIAELPARCRPVSKIIVLLGGQEFLRQILCLYLKVYSGSQYPTYQFIAINQAPDSIIRDTNFTFNRTTPLECSKQEIADLEKRLIFIQYRLKPLDRDTVEPSTPFNHSEFVTEYQERVEEHNRETGEAIEQSLFATAHFDATWALALALNNSRDEVRNSTGLDLAQYTYGHRNVTDIIRKHLLRLDFIGVSGRIKFNESTGFTERPIDIHQFHNGEFQRLAYYNSSSDAIHNYTVGLGVEYCRDDFEFVSVSLHIGLPLILFVLLLIALVITMHIVHLVYTNHPQIKATHPKLYMFAFFGIYLEAFATVVYIMGDTFGFDSADQCNLKYCFELFRSTGNVLFFSSLLAISFRVYRIFVHYMHPGKLISDRFLIGFVVLATTSFFVVYSILAVILLPKPEEVCERVEDNMVFGRVNCSIERKYIPLKIAVDTVPLFTLSVLSAVFSTMVLYCGRVNIKQFKANSVHIAVVSYLFICVCFGWIIFYVIVEAHVPDFDLGLTISAGSTILNICFGAFILFLTPIVPIFKESNIYRTRLKPWIGPRWRRAKERLACQCTSTVDSDTDKTLPQSTLLATEVSLATLTTQTESETNVPGTVELSAKLNNETTLCAQESTTKLDTQESDTCTVDSVPTVNTRTQDDRFQCTEDHRLGDDNMADHHIRVTIEVHSDNL